MGEDLITRQLSGCDRLTDAQYAQLAGLIYQTDPYIYPALFSGKKDAADNAAIVLSHLLKSGGDAMFQRQNLFVCGDGRRMLGLVLWRVGRLDWDQEGFMRAAAEAGVSLSGDAVRKVRAEYFDAQYATDSREAPERIAVINVCVDPRFRGRGVGGEMFRRFITLHASSPISLCVLADNVPAIRLYRSCGFEVVGHYPGFSPGADKPECLEMFRKPV